MKHLPTILLIAVLALLSVVGGAAGAPANSLVYSTFLGSDGDEQGRAVALDEAGRAYVTGYTSSVTFPSNAPNHGVDVFAVRFDPTGSSTEYLYWFNALTLFAEDEGFSVAIDPQGNAYLTGYTRSEDFCQVFGTVPGYHPTYFGETDAFALKIKADGSGLAYCTFLGGSDWDAGRAIAVDSQGNAYVVGGTWSIDFPITPGAVQSSLADLRDVFLVRLDPSGTQLEYSTYLGGAGQEEGAALAIAGAGEIVYVAGWTNSDDFPVTAGVLDPTYGGNTDGFLFRLDLSGQRLDFATYLGGAEEDRLTGLGVQGGSGLLAAGYTQSPDFPTTPGALASSPLGGVDGFVAAVFPDGHALDWATFLGGAGNDHIWGMAVGESGAPLVVGETTSSDFPVTPDALDAALNGASDAFLARLGPRGSDLVYGAYLGGSGSERGYGVAEEGAAGTVAVTGLTHSADFPVTSQAFDSQYNGAGDIFVSRFALDIPTPPRPRVWLPLLRRS